MEGLVHLIIWLIQTRVSRSGSVTKKIRCENCTLSYEYELRRTVKLMGESSKEALGRQAESQLRKELEEGSDPVPCPACGWYQRHMIERARREAMRKVPAWIVIVLISTAITTTVALLWATDRARFGRMPPWLGPLAVVASGVGGLLVVLFIVQRVYRRFAYNPNGSRWENDARQDCIIRD
jgi:hypothetical protein